MRRFVLDSVLVHVVQHNFKNNIQCGSAPNWSPLANMLCAQHDFSTLHDTRQGVEVVFLNISMAFNIVNRLCLLAKLEALAVSSMLCKWVATFLKLQVGDQLFPHLPSSSEVSGSWAYL